MREALEGQQVKELFISASNCIDVCFTTVHGASLALLRDEVRHGVKEATKAESAWGRCSSLLVHRSGC